MSHRLREVEARLEQTEQQLRLLQRISRLVSRDFRLSEALRSVVTLITDLMYSDSCLIYLLRGNKLELSACSADTVETVGKVALTLEEGLTGWVARERRLLAISREAYADARFKYFKDLPEDTFEAFLSAPIIARNRVVGVINVQHRAAHTHSGSELEMITTIGELLGCMIFLDRNADIRRSEMAPATI
ncbi:MAG TPA: GAF domain-containing protein [Bryobacteraceae bacterium]|nr:GAF domain-containing protein [Bryobacteraceae bacterium]